MKVGIKNGVAFLAAAVVVPTTALTTPITHAEAQAIKTRIGGFEVTTQNEALRRLLNGGLHVQDFKSIEEIERLAYARERAPDADMHMDISKD